MSRQRDAVTPDVIDPQKLVEAMAQVSEFFRSWAEQQRMGVLFQMAARRDDEALERALRGLSDEQFDRIGVASSVLHEMIINEHRHRPPRSGT